MKLNKRQKIPVGKEAKLVFETSDDGKNFTVRINKEKVVITRADLMGLLFLYADKKQQEDLLTATEIKMKPIARLLTFTLKEDLKEGDKIKAWYQYLLPVEYANKLIEVAPHKYKNAEVTIDQVSQEMEHIKL